MMPKKHTKKRKTASRPLVGIVMGSHSDWETMEHAANVLKAFKIPHEAKVVSAHRTPKRLYDYASSAKSRGLSVIIAGAGGAAHLPGMIASLTTLPVFGVPIKSKSLDGIDSLLSIAQMPAGVPVGTLAIGKAGAINAGLLATSVLSLHNQALDKLFKKWRDMQTASVKQNPKAKKSNKKQ